MGSAISLADILRMIDNVRKTTNPDLGAWDYPFTLRMIDDNRVMLLKTWNECTGISFALYQRSGGYFCGNHRWI